MTAWQAGAANLIFHQPDRQLPCTKWNGIPDMLGIIRSVGIMTGTAGSSLRGFVDMHVMQILVTVPEAGQSCGFCILHQSIVMAVEAELVVIRVIFCVEYRGIGIPQNPEVV